MFASLFAGSKTKRSAHEIYQQIVSAARAEKFYRPPYGVEDTVEGRFELILIHIFLADRFLSQNPQLVKLRRALQEVLINDMDRSLREMGIGDMSVGKQMKKVGAALLGRLKSYELALEANDKDSLKEIISRNIQSQDSGYAEYLADYIFSSSRAMAETDATNTDNFHKVFSV